MIADSKGVRPDRPCFTYLAFGATHAPHQAPPSFLAKYRGRYDEGLDVVRERWYARQLELGIIPQGTALAPRNPGVRAWDLYAVGNDIDIYREWAMAVVHGHPSQVLSRRFATGIIALRPEHDGAIAGYDGLDRVQEQFGEWVIDFHLPPEGTPTQPVEAGYMANAWIRMKHENYDHLRQMLDLVGRTVRVRAR